MGAGVGGEILVVVGKLMERPFRFCVMRPREGCIIRDPDDNVRYGTLDFAPFAKRQKAKYLTFRKLSSNLLQGENMAHPVCQFFLDALAQVECLVRRKNVVTSKKITKIDIFVKNLFLCVFYMGFKFSSLIFDIGRRGEQGYIRIMGFHLWALPCANSRSG